MGFFIADFGNFENGWEDLWEFHDSGWEFLYLGSNHTAAWFRSRLVKGERTVLCAGAKAQSDQ